MVTALLYRSDGQEQHLYLKPCVGVGASIPVYVPFVCAKGGGGKLQSHTMLTF